MNNASSEASSVVSLHPARTREAARLLEAVRGIAIAQLRSLLQRLFENVDDALFDLAEKAEHNAAQTRYFDGMREVRKRRPAIERDCLAQIEQQLLDPAPPAFGPEPAAEHELEESLAITSMVGKNENRLARELPVLHRRLGLIRGDALDDASNPLGPAALAQAFRQAMRGLETDLRVKLIVYKLFDRYVLAALDELYREIGETLIRAGAPAEPERGGSAAAEVAEALPQRLQALLDARRAGRRPAPAAAPLPTAGELIDALSLLQNQIIALAPGQAQRTAELVQEVQQLKQQLLGQLGALRGERPGQGQVARVDEDTIDLVGMLFEFILADRELPAEMQVLLARLQVPYLKAALLDRRLFVQRQHPARRLLDDLADAAQGWSTLSDRDGRRYEAIQRIVEKLLLDFGDDLAIFERLSAELQTLLEQDRQRAGLAEQRVAEAAQGREKLEQARRRVLREIRQRTQGHALPPLIQQLLYGAWTNYLVLILLRQGESTAVFHDALRLVDGLVESARPMLEPAARLRLRQLLPGIERALHHGLASVAFQEGDIERLLARLHTYYRHQLGEVVAAAELHAAIDAISLPESFQTAAAPSEPGDPAPPTGASGALQLASALAIGTWLAFDNAERAKLSWISPVSGRLLFVNQRGLKVADYSMHELSARLAGGSARVLESSALFDRALGAIAERLRHTPAP